MRTKPDATDKHVGERVRMRRIKIGMSREKLGGALASPIIRC